MTSIEAYKLLVEKSGKELADQIQIAYFKGETQSPLTKRLIPSLIKGVPKLINKASLRFVDLR
jgi:hypothetical protein